MKRKIVSLVLALAMTLGMAGCGNSSSSANTESTAETSVSTTLRYGLTSGPENMDPTNLSELYAYRIVRQCYNGLTDRATDGSVTDTGLAKSWTVNEEGTEYHFVLKKGIKFHSGAELTSKDVKFTFERILNPEGTGDGISFLEGIVGAADMIDGKTTELAGFKTDNDYEFTITFENPEFMFPEYCSAESLYIVDSSVVDGAEDNWWETQSAGTGPFSLKSFVADEKIELKANPDYFNGAPSVSTVEFIVVDDENTQYTMYQNDELDVIDAPYAELENIKADDNMKNQLVEYPTAAMTYLGMNQSLYEPFQDARVREAISLVISTDTLADKIMARTACPLYGVIPQDFCGYNDSIKAPEYNVKKAKELLKEAGYNENNPLPEISLAYLPMDEDNAVFIADQLKNELGWDVKLDGPDRSTMIDTLWEYKYEFFIFGGTADYGDAGCLLSMFTTDAGRNFGLYSNKDYDSLIEKASSTADVDERNKLYQEAEQLLMDDHAMIPLYVDKSFLLVKPSVSGLRYSPLGMDSLEDVVIK